MHYWSFICFLFISKTSFNQYPPVNQFWADFFIKLYIFNIVRNSLETSQLICVPNQITYFHIGCNNTESIKMYGNLDNISSDDTYPSKHLLVLKTSSRRLQDMSSTRLQRNNFTFSKTSWRYYGDKQNTYWGYLYLTNLNVYLTNLYLTNLHLTIQNKSKANSKRIK